MKIKKNVIKRQYQQSKMKWTKWEKIFVNHVSDK